MARARSTTPAVVVDLAREDVAGWATSADLSRLDELAGGLCAEDPRTEAAALRALDDEFDGLGAVVGYMAGPGGSAGIRGQLRHLLALGRRETALRAWAIENGVLLPAAYVRWSPARDDA